MKSFSKRPLLTGLSFLLIFFFVGMTCCTKVDDRLGLNFIPEDQKMRIYRDVFGVEAAQQVRSYTQMLDSIQASGMSAMVLGRISDANFGKTTTASIFQVLPYDASTAGDDFYYGFSELNIADSLKLYINPVFLGGDSTKIQKFVIYALTDTLIVDTTYYQDFDFRAIKDNTPLFTFELSGSYSAAESITAQSSTAGLELLQDIISDTTYFYDNRVNFRQRFKGFVVEPAADSPEDAAIYSVDLSNAYFYLQFHTRVTGSSVPKDTIQLPLYMYDTVADDGVSNVSMILFSHDYSGTPIEQALTLTENQTPQQAVFVDAFAGVTTRLEFPDEFFDAILAKRKLEDGALADLSLNQAQLFVQLDDDDTDIMDGSFQKLGSFYDFRKDITIPDYSLADEYGASSGGNYFSSYGGELNRTAGRYSLNITTFLHYALKMYERKINGEDYDEMYMMLTLAPPSHYVYPVAKLTAFGRTAIQGTGSGTPIELRLTYTLIERDL